MRRIFNYAALEEPLEKTDIESYKQSRVGGSSFIDIFRSKAAVIPLGILCLWLVSISFRVRSMFPILIFLSAAAIFGFVYWISFQNVTKLRARLFKFAMQNNLHWIEDIADPRYPGMIFDEGDSQRIDEALRFNDGTEIGNFTYETGSGKNRRPYTLGYVRIKLLRRLPHMVLDAKENNILRKFSNLSDSFDRSQVLSLEGDFDSYFTLYAPKKYEQDALYVFTPDVMASLIDYGKYYDIEIVDDELYIYNITRFSLEKPELYSPLFAIIDTIGGKLINQTDYYADERIGNRAANIVSPAGRRLEFGMSWLLVIVIAVIVYLLVIQPLLLL